MASRVIFIVKVLIALASFGSARWALAQDAEPAEVETTPTNAATMPISGATTSVRPSLAPPISRALERQVRLLIERHVAPVDFQVAVTATAAPATEQQSLPYLPETLIALPIDIMPIDEVMALATKVDIEVFVAQRVNGPTQQKIAALLTKKLGLNSKRGDQVTFTQLGIELPSPESDLARSLAKSEADARAAAKQAEGLGRERDDAKRDLSLAKTELDLVSRDAKQKIAAAEKASEKSSERNGNKKDDKASDKAAAAPPAKPTDLPRVKGFFEENLPLIIAGGLILLALLAASLVVRGSATVIGNAFQGIGDSLPLLAEKLGDAIANKSVDAPQAQKLLEGGERPKDAAPTTPAYGNMPVEALHARILTLHDELLEGLNPATEAIILRHVSRLLDTDGVALAVVSLELLGRDKANELFNKLGREHQILLWDFLQSGRYDRPKVEIMLEAGEELKTKMLGELFGSVRGLISEKVAERLIKLDVDDLAQVTAALQPALLPRLFLYFEPSRLAAIISALRLLPNNKVEDAMAALSKVPEVERAVDLDDAIVVALDAQISLLKDDSQRAYLGWFKSISEALDDELAETMAAQLAKANPRLERYVRDNMITFSTFFILRAEVQEDLLGNLSNRDLGALLYGLSDGLKAQVTDLLAERRRAMIGEEIERLTARGDRPAKEAHRQIRLQVTAKVRALKGSGSLDEYLAAAPKQRGLDLNAA